MALGDRSISVVLQDINANVQEIVRSEVRLAKTEIREEVATARPWAQMLGAGAVAALFAILFVLLMIVHALALIMPMWAASLSVGAALAMSASFMLTAGMKRFQLTPGQPIKTTQEKIQWAKQQAK